MNKNSKQRKVATAKSVKAGNRDIVFDRSYVNAHGNSYRNIGVTVPSTESANARRNMRQVVLINTGENGQKSSLTVHEPIMTDRPCKHKNHGYLEKQYTQPKGIRA